MKKILQSVFEILFPRYCHVCGNRLNTQERFICTSCALSLPYTNYLGYRGNPVERMFWHIPQLERATAFLHYHAHTESIKPVLALKYFGKEALGEYLGRLAAEELLDTDFFSQMDCIVPLPLHKKRQARRGYNQSHCIAQGVSLVSGLPIVADAVQRTKDTTTQTHLTIEQRRENVKGIFTITRPELLAGKHILLIDDVITTGSTLSACAQTIAELPNVHISILSLYVAGHPGIGYSVQNIKEQRVRLKADISK